MVLKGMLIKVNDALDSRQEHYLCDGLKAQQLLYKQMRDYQLQSRRLRATKHRKDNT